MIRKVREFLVRFYRALREVERDLIEDISPAILQRLRPWGRVHEVRSNVAGPSGGAYDFVTYRCGRCGYHSQRPPPCPYCGAPAANP